jgi:hypothetical protein
VEEGVRRPTQRELFVVFEKLYSIYHREKNSASLREGEKERDKEERLMWLGLCLWWCESAEVCMRSQGKKEGEERREFREKVGERKF